MKRVKPTLTDWKKLYKAATEFKEIECWKWMSDIDILGIQNPYTEEIGYCCVLGNLGKVFALNVYLGENGLKVLFKCMNDEQASDDPDLFYQYDCLMTSFVNRNELSNRDLNTIKKTGLKFRGKKQWPLIRRLKPGFEPWFLTKSEAKFLTIALQQTKKVALRFKANKNLLKPPEKNFIYLLVPEKKGGELKWKEEWIKPEFNQEKILIPILTDPFIEKLKNSFTLKQSEWEIDFFYTPFSVREKKDEVPYYPFYCLFVERSSGLILNSHLTNEPDYMREFMDNFLDIITQNKMIPERIFVKSEKCYLLFKHITEKLGIDLQMVKNLKVLDEVRKILFKRM